MNNNKEAQRKQTVRGTFTDELGQRHYVRGADEKDVAVKIALLQDELRRGAVILDRGTTVAEWAENYLAVFVRPRAGKQYAADTERLVRKRVLPEIGAFKISQVRTIQLQQILVGAKDMSYSYRYKLTLILKQLFRSARQNRLILTDPAETLRFPSRNDESIGRALTDEERAAIEPFLSQHRFGGELAVMLYAGLRDQEVMALDQTDIDLAGKRIYVSKSLKADGTIGPPKTKSGVRSVPIRDKLVPFLERALEGEGPSLFHQAESGRRHTKKSFRAGWANFVRELNIALGCRVVRNKLVPPYPLAEDLRPYYFRHTFCTDCEKNGIPVQVTSRIMGHASVSVTLKYYTHATKEVEDMALALMNNGK